MWKWSTKQSTAYRVVINQLYCTVGIFEFEPENYLACYLAFRLQTILKFYIGLIVKIDK